VAGRGDRLHRPAGARDLAAAAKADVGVEAQVVAGLHLRRAGLVLDVALDRAAVDGRPGGGFQRPGQRRVVGVVVGDQDVADRLAGDGRSLPRGGSSGPGSITATSPRPTM
jgi:hypothetical protein